MIRPATPSDTNALRRLQTELREPNPESLEYALQDPPGTTLLVAGHPPIGYILAFSGARNTTTNIAELVVHPRERRNYIGTQLLSELKRRVESSTIELVVHPDNTNGIQFYQQNNFTVREELPRFYDDARGLLMSHSPRN